MLGFAWLGNKIYSLIYQMSWQRQLLTGFSLVIMGVGGCLADVVGVFIPDIGAESEPKREFSVPFVGGSED